uniref:Uncharacterized protein n=1 Tax=Physcomitrium patens TaxID=3218 RepID=A0A7I3ZVX3_PHYPA
MQAGSICFARSFHHFLLNICPLLRLLYFLEIIVLRYIICIMIGIVILFLGRLLPHLRFVLSFRGRILGFVLLILLDVFRVGLNKLSI